LEVLGPPSVPIRLSHRGTAPSSFDRACVSAMRAWCVHWDPRALPPSRGGVSRVWVSTPGELAVEPPRPPIVMVGGARLRREDRREGRDEHRGGIGHIHTSSSLPRA